MEFDYEKFKKTTSLKLPIITIAIALPIILELGLIPYYIETFNQDENYARACAGVLVIFVELLLIWKLSCYIRILTSKAWAEKFYIKAHDERLTLIDRKANTFTTLATLYIVGTSAAIAGCFDAKVFFTLLATFFGIILIYGISYLYYSKKN